MSDQINIHATGLLYRGFGLLIRGSSGAGKSLLALSLLEYASRTQQDAMLVGDDRLEILMDSGKIQMRAPMALQGKIELWGRGILDVEFTPFAKVDLIVDIIDHGERMPEDAAFVEQFHGLELPRCPIPSVPKIGFEHQHLLLLVALEAIKK